MHFSIISIKCTLNLSKNLKLYYSIKEVAEMFGLNESTLRYWETEFPYLKPKTAGNNKVRQYSEKDIEQIKLIHNLVKFFAVKIFHRTTGYSEEAFWKNVDGFYHETILFVPMMVGAMETLGHGSGAIHIEWGG